MTNHRSWDRRYSQSLDHAAHPRRRRDRVGDGISAAGGSQHKTKTTSVVPRRHRADNIALRGRQRMQKASEVNNTDREVLLELNRNYVRSALGRVDI